MKRSIPHLLSRLYRCVSFKQLSAISCICLILASASIIGGVAKAESFCSKLIAKLLRPNSLLGMDNLAPESLEFRKIRSQIQNLRSRSDFPNIDPTKLTLKKISDPYTSPLLTYVYSGKMKGREIVAIGGIAKTDLLQEARLYILLNKLGLCPQFLGVTQDAEGNDLIVLERVYGILVKRKGFRPEKLLGLHATDQTILEIQNTGQLLHKIGIRSAPDLQFLITDSGKPYLIDLEYLFDEPNMGPDPRDEASWVVTKLKEFLNKVVGNLKPNI